jgi:hypothetical protein
MVALVLVQVQQTLMQVEAVAALVQSEQTAFNKATQAEVMVVTA